jgi:pimeloyl-ACP methyl ester carboxylesterase
MIARHAIRRTALTLLFLIGLAATPRTAAHAQRADGSASGSFRSDDAIRLAYAVRGSGPPIVFIRGWSLPAAVFDRQVQALSREFRVVTFDPRGQGASASTERGRYRERRAEPLLYIHQPSTASQAAIIQAAQLQARIVEMSEGGHMMFAADTGRFNQTLIDFLREGANQP